MICAPMRIDGFSEVIGSWKIIEMAVAADARRAPRRWRGRGRWPRKRISPLGDLAGRERGEAEDRLGGDALAAAALADDRQHLAAGRA